MENYNDYFNINNDLFEDKNLTDVFSNESNLQEEVSETSKKVLKGIGLTGLLGGLGYGFYKGNEYLQDKYKQDIMQNLDQELTKRLVVDDDTYKQTLGKMWNAKEGIYKLLSDEIDDKIDVGHWLVNKKSANDILDKYNI